MAPTLFEMPGHLIRRLNQHSAAVFQHRLKAAGHDLTAVQFSALARLAKQPGIDQATLASQIEYDRATIGGVVKRLAQKELLKREPNEKDQRAFRLYLTPAGAALLDDTWPIVDALQDDILSKLSGAERQALVQLMQKALQLDDAGDSP
jgi:DNA-binding MarR family transcriptional regulator